MAFKERRASRRVQAISATKVFQEENTMSSQDPTVTVVNPALAPAPADARHPAWHYALAVLAALLLVVGLLWLGSRVHLFGTPAPTPVPTVVVEKLADAPVAAAPALAPTANTELTTAAVPTAAPAANNVLKYDETNGISLPKGQTKLIALYLRDAMAAEGTQSAMEKAVSLIQKEAASVGAETGHGKTFTPDRSHAWLVWHSNANQVTQIPTDVSDVMGSHRKGAGKVWIVVPFADGVPRPVKNTFSCTEGEFYWAAIE